MSETFYIADLHLGHKNCLAFDNRPFSDIDEQDNVIINRWNKAVNPDDTVWILGDISWYPANKTAEIMMKLRGHKNLIIGNHDEKLIRDKKLARCFDEITYYKEITDGETRVVLCHYPIPCFKSHYHGWMHLYGHVHNGMEWNLMKKVKGQQEALWDKEHHMYNVGAMVGYMDYTPRSLKYVVNANKFEV